MKRHVSTDSPQKKFAINDRVVFDGRLATVVLQPTAKSADYWIRCDGDEHLTRAAKLEAVPEPDLLSPDDLTSWILDERGRSVSVDPVPDKSSRAAFLRWMEKKVLAEQEHEG